MKKNILITTLLVIALSLVGCGKTNSTDKDTEGKSDSSGYEIALITDIGSIDDKSFNQSAWEGVVQYAKENEKTYKYYKPTEQSNEAFITAINLAIKGGAKVVVCSGYLYEVPVYTVQKQNPDVAFILLDGQPNDGADDYYTSDNTKAIFYAEEQAGFLAGYAAVKDGYKKLGFMGGAAMPSVVRFGYGYVQGAEYAAKELGLNKNSISVKYTYLGNFDATPENMAVASSWYNEGVEVIFSAAGSVGSSVMKAAETAGAKVIGVDVDQSAESNTVITSAMKNLKKSIYDSLTEYFKGTFKGGESVILGASTNNVQLPMNTSKFKTFTEQEYDSIYKKIVDETIKIKKNDSADSVTDLNTEHVTISVVE